MSWVSQAKTDYLKMNVNEPKRSATGCRSRGKIFPFMRET